MKQKIYKYPLPSTDISRIEMPQGSKILCVQIQNDSPFVWVLVDCETKNIDIKILEIICTGQEFPYDKNRNYIGTFQFNTKMALVYHLFEILPEYN